MNAKYKVAPLNFGLRPSLPSLISKFETEVWCQRELNLGSLISKPNDRNAEK